nr:HAD family acid phosphatase [Sphingomonas jejuensis]
MDGAGAGRAPAPVEAAQENPIPKSLLWLHGSGEAALLARRTFSDMADYVVAAERRRAGGAAVESAVMAPSATLDAPRWTECGSKPAAVIFDVDETAILNTGANYDAATHGDPPFDAARWARWEEGGADLVEPMPGLASALATMRAAGVTVVFNSNREARFAAQAAAAIRGAGLGEAVHGETLFLRGDIAPGSGKDPRRAAIAARYCVLAMAGDQMGDFADAYNDRALSVAARRQRVATAPAGERIGRGWFLLANPAYGPWDRGGLDDLFPADRRWPRPVAPGTPAP